MHHIKIGSKEMPLPASPIARIMIGAVLVVMGMFGFLPVLGFWMIPLGIVVLSVDISFIRRLRRRVLVWWGRKRKRRRRV